MVWRRIQYLGLLFIGIMQLKVWGFSAENPHSEPQITMDVAYGYDNSVKGGRFVPVFLTFHNSGSDDFQGEVRFLAMESDQRIYRYDFPIGVGADEMFETYLDIPLGVYSDQMYIMIVDGQQEEILRSPVKLNISKEYAELFVGMLSDSVGELGYFDDVGMNYGLLKTKVFPLSQENFPDDQIGLNLLDVIIISDYQTSRLSAGQIQALNSWIEQGGLLLLGTGERIDDVVMPFAAELFDRPYSAARKMLVNLGVEYAVSGPGDSQVSMACADLVINDGEIVFSDDQLTLVAVKKREKGAIAVAAFDFKELNDFARQNPAYVEKLLTTLLGEDNINRISDVSAGTDSEQFRVMKNMLDTGDPHRIPNISVYGFVIFLYLAVIGPLFYLALKRRKMSRYYYAGVMGISLVFTGVIYLLGSGTRFRSAFFTYVTICDLSPEEINETSYINIRNPDNKAYQIGVDASYIIKPVTQLDDPDGHSGFRFSGIEQPDFILKHRTDQTYLTAAHVNAFESQYLQLDKRYQNLTQQGFISNITWMDGTVSGTITSGFPYPLDHAALLWNGQIVKLGKIEPGVTISLDQEEPVYLPLGYWEETVNYLIQEQPAVQTDQEKLFSDWQESNLLAFYLKNYSVRGWQEGRIIGIYTDPEGHNFLTQQGHEVNGISLLTSVISLETEKNGLVYRSGTGKKPKTISGQYSSADNTITWGDTAVLEYFLGNDIAIEQLNIYTVSDIFQNTGSINSFSGEIYFYNYDKAGFELIEDSDRILDSNRLKEFLSPGNTLTVKYVCGSEVTSNWDVLLPFLMVTGRKE